MLVSIMLVSAMGCGIMTGLSGAYVSLETSLDDYVENYRYPNAVITTDVTSRKNIDKLKEIKSVSQINVRLCGDTYIKSKEGRYLSVRVFSYNPDDIQKFNFWSQADSGGKDDVFIECNFAKDNGIKAGDTLKFKVDREYREYFVSGIVSMPETLSVQPTDNSFGANTDFGYAYAPAGLLKNEYGKKYSEVKDELDEKQNELDSEWDKAQKELDDAEKKLNDAKSQLAEKESLFEDSSAEAAEKLAQLEKTESALDTTKKTLENKRKELLDTKQTLQKTVDLLKENRDKLYQAADGLKQIDDGLENIENIKSEITSDEIVQLMDLLKFAPNLDMEYLFDNAENVRSFIETMQKYGFSYDLTDNVSEFSEKIGIYAQQIEEDYSYLNSDEILSLPDNEKEKAVSVIKKYILYDESAGLAENADNAIAVIEFIRENTEKYDIDKVVSYLSVLESDRSVEKMLSDISDMKTVVEEISEYMDKPVKTTGDLTDVYSGALGEIEKQESQLILQREKIEDTLAEYGLSESDLADIPALMDKAESGFAQIDDGIKKIDENIPKITDSLKEIADGRQLIISNLDEAEKQLSDAKKEISKNEKKLNDETAKALSEFADLEEELEKAYSELEEGEGYEMLCNQFLIYFKDGAESKAELEKLKSVLADEKIEVKSSFTYEESAVKKRIDVNLEPIETMSIFMPMVFFLIILIVVFLFMSLIIKQSRREIGILRALGFSKTSIKILYCEVNLIVSVFSIILGSVIGYCLTKYVGEYYKNFFPLPEFTYRANIGMYLLSAVLTIVVGQISTLISAGTISKIMPSEAMSRPAPETAEIPKILQKLTAKSSPVAKFSVATMLRNKMRFAFSVICISASVMMIFSALAFITSKNYLLHQLYDERIHYDCQIFFKENPTDDFMQKMSELPFVRDVQKMPYYQADFTFKGKTKSAFINSLDINSELVGIYDRNNRKISVPEQGIILEKHLAEELGADVGDTVNIDGVPVKIEKISDQSISRFQYMSYKSAEKLGDMTLGSVICNISEKDEQKLLGFLTEDDNYLYSVFTRLSYKANERIFKTYDLAAWIIIGFAIVIGLVIVINTAQTNLLEKKRELCVLRTLGFQHREISVKWFVQSFLQFVFSCIIGLPSGAYIAKIALQKLSTEGREYVFANSFNEYIFTILLVFAYVGLSHIIAMHSMKKWDIVESVKDKE